MFGSLYFISGCCSYITCLIRLCTCHRKSAALSESKFPSPPWHSDLERYRQFFGIVSDQELKEEADALKEKGDFTSPDSFKVSRSPVGVTNASKLRALMHSYFVL